MYNNDPFAGRGKPSFVQHVLVGVLLFVVVGFIGYEIGVQASTSRVRELGDGTTTELNFENFYKVKALLEKKFLHDDRFDDEKMTQGAIAGMVASLEDFYTTYFPPEDAEEFRDFLFSELEGIGAELTVSEEGIITVVSPLKGTPAEKAGLLPKDKILKIDGEMAGSELFDAVKRIKGPAGTEVCLTILHEDAKETEEICITRAVIDVPAVEWEEKENDIYHVSLRVFDDSVQTELEEILTTIKSRNPKGLILDLRYNGGGFLSGATRVASLFLPAGKKVTKIHARNGEDTRSEYTRGTPIFYNYPLVVLVNEGSASASEILAAALQYYAGATVVGETTFGKVTAQEVIDLDDGGLIRITIAKWHTPDGKTLDDGLKPDIEVENDRETEEDEQLQKALELF